MDSAKEQVFHKVQEAYVRYLSAEGPFFTITEQDALENLYAIAQINCALALIDIEREGHAVPDRGYIISLTAPPATKKRAREAIEQLGSLYEEIYGDGRWDEEKESLEQAFSKQKREEYWKERHESTEREAGK